MISIFKSLFLAHRLVWLYVYGEWPPDNIDHIDGNPSNNAISNLRAASQRQNSWNSKTLKNNKLGMRNVSFCKVMNKFLVQFMQGKAKRIYKEYFSTLEEAIADRDRVAALLHGGFARKFTTPIDKNSNHVYP